MFGKKRASTVVEEVEFPVVSIEERLGRGIALNNNQLLEAKTEFDEYCQLAKEVGVLNSPSIFERKLEIFLTEENIPIYDSGKVHRHLINLGIKLNKSYVWCPLRERDFDSDCAFQHLSFVYLGSVLNGYNHYFGVVIKDVYTKPIPASVLFTVKKINDAFPEARFFVSDFVTIPKADPFLAVTVPRGLFCIVDFWHEPGFKP